MPRRTTDLRWLGVALTGEVSLPSRDRMDKVTTTKRITINIGGDDGLELIDVPTADGASDLVTVNFPSYGVAFVLRRTGVGVFDGYMVHSAGELVRIPQQLVPKLCIILTLFWPCPLVASELTRYQLSEQVARLEDTKKEVMGLVSLPKAPEVCGQVHALVDPGRSENSEAQFFYPDAASSQRLGVLETEIAQVVVALSALRVKAKREKHREARTRLRFVPLPCVIANCRTATSCFSSTARSTSTVQDTPFRRTAPTGSCHLHSKYVLLTTPFGGQLSSDPTMSRRCHCRRRHSRGRRSCP